MTEGRKNEKVIKYSFGALLAVYAVALVYLYYNQQFYVETGIFESDTFMHIKFAVEDGFFHSLAAFIYVALYALPFSKVLISLVLTAATIGSIFASIRLIKLICEKMSVNISDGVVYIMSFAGNVLMAFYISFVCSQHYIGYECANMWHNSTYIFMRVFSVLTVIAYLKHYEALLKEASFKRWLVLTGFLCAATGFKASFLTVFAPALAIVLLIDLYKGAKFKNVFVIATTVILPIAIMGLQSIIISDKTSDGGFIISPFTALKLRGEHPKVALVLSVAYPLCVLFFHLKDYVSNKLSRSMLIMWIIAFLEVFLLAESGERSLDGNFMWGYSIALFFLFIVSMVISFKAFLTYRDKILNKALFSVETLILLWHVISGIWYFCLLLTGVTYFV